MYRTPPRPGPPPQSVDEATEARLRLRAIVRQEGTACQLLQLELAAAIEVTKPDPAVRVAAARVTDCLTAAREAYDELLAQLDRLTPPNVASRSSRPATDPRRARTAPRK